MFFDPELDFDQNLRKVIKQGMEQDALRDLRRIEQKRKRTHAPNRRSKSKLAKESRRRNR